MWEGTLRHKKKKKKKNKRPAAAGCSRSKPHTHPRHRPTSPVPVSAVEGRLSLHGLVQQNPQAVQIHGAAVPRPHTRFVVPNKRPGEPALFVDDPKRNPIFVAVKGKPKRNKTPLRGSALKTDAPILDGSQGILAGFPKLLTTI